MRYKGRLWLAYRFHLKEDHGRCATAIVELDQKTLQPVGKNQRLMLSGPTGREHHEDARLFMFDGKPHISYTEMRGYKAKVDYQCVIRYAQLRLRGERWDVMKVYQPEFGENDGRAKEKNWTFFEMPDGLHAVYSIHPKHVVIKLDGHRVVRTYEADGPMWHFGTPRGGASPLLQSDGSFLSIFHSSLPSEPEPNWRRYYGSAYTFEAKPPFTPLRISTRPIMAGSEADGHAKDPRNEDGWKPFVVFPCGLVEDNAGWLVSLGVNDWTCAIGKLKPKDLYLGAANGSDILPRYFRCENASMPVQVNGEDGRPRMLYWEITKRRFGLSAVGYMKCINPMEAQVVAEHTGTSEVEFNEFDRVQGDLRMSARSVVGV